MYGTKDFYARQAASLRRMLSRPNDLAARIYLRRMLRRAERRSR